MCVACSGHQTKKKERLTFLHRRSLEDSVQQHRLLRSRTEIQTVAVPDVIDEERGDLVVVLADFLTQLRLGDRVRVGRVAELGIQKTLDDVLLLRLVHRRCICRFLLLHSDILYKHYDPITTALLRPPLFN